MYLKDAIIPTDDATSNPSPKTQKRSAKLGILRKTITKRDSQIKSLQQKIRRSSKKIAKLTDILKELQENNLLSEENSEVLASVGGSNNQIFKRQTLKFHNKTLPKKYEPEIRSFALNLNFLSPKAYLYVRDNFNSCLPHPRTISSWYQSVNCQPGFTTEAFNALRNAVDVAKLQDDQVVINISFDEICIRQLVEWNGSSSTGYVDMGDGGNSNIMASQVFVFMAVSVKKPWKIPLGFFPISTLDSLQKKNMITHCIRNCLQTGAEVVGITFDGLSTNWTAAKLLGCDINNVDAMPIFHLDDYKDDFIVIPDPCHMIKLVRNTFGDLKQFCDCNGGIVDWVFLERLVDLQEKEELHLGNKLRRAHVYFSQQKMKVRLAVQAMSRSVADAIDFCRLVLKLPEFADSEPTFKFLIIFNTIFDILNTRNINRFDHQKALCAENFAETNKFCEYAIHYIKNLKLPSGELLITHRRKTGFIGIIANLQSISILHNRFIITKKLTFVPYYKLNQDHLELFFSSIRLSLGYNNNPSVRQFIAAYKKLIIRSEIREHGIGNCVPLQSINILNISSTKCNPDLEINLTTDGRAEDVRNTHNDNFLTLEDESFLLENEYILNYTLSNFTEHVVKYIAGFVVFKLNKTIKCQHCLAALQGDFDRDTLLAFKTKGMLQIPSVDVVYICKVVEKVLRSMKSELEEGNTLLHSKHFEKIVILAENLLIGKDIFLENVLHTINNNHYALLINSIIKKYLKTRYFYMARNTSLKNSSIRSKFTKLILFKGM